MGVKSDILMEIEIIVRWAAILDPICPHLRTYYEFGVIGSSLWDGLSKATALQEVVPAIT